MTIFLAFFFCTTGVRTNFSCAYFHLWHSHHPEFFGHFVGVEYLTGACGSRRACLNNICFGNLVVAPHAPHYCNGFQVLHYYTNCIQQLRKHHSLTSRGLFSHHIRAIPNMKYTPQTNKPLFLASSGTAMFFKCQPSMKLQGGLVMFNEEWCQLLHDDICWPLSARKTFWWYRGHIAIRVEIKLSSTKGFIKHEVEKLFSFCKRGKSRRICFYFLPPFCECSDNSPSPNTLQLNFGYRIHH